MKRSNNLLVKNACILLALIVFYMSSCKTTDPDCYKSVIVLNRLEFFKRDSVPKTIVIDSATNSTRIDTVEVFNDSTMNQPHVTVIGEDSFYSVYTNQSHLMSVPLNPSKDSIRYQFYTDSLSTVFDTLTFHYTYTTHFIDNACGYTYYYNLTKVTTTNNMLDSAAIVTPEVTDASSATNVHFYFKRRQ